MIELRCMELWGGNEAVDTAISVPGMDGWVYARPYAAADAGGDFHYVSSCAGGKIGRFVLADVAGHGLSVDLVAKSLRDMMRSQINTLDQTGLARSLNTLFHASGEGTRPGQFATAALLTYYRPSSTLLYCIAGHPPPLHYKAQTNTWAVLDTQDDPAVAAPGQHDPAMNLPLGIIEPTNYAQHRIKLMPGDMIVVYSDAFFEAEDAHGKMLGHAGLIDLLARGPKDPQALVRFLFSCADGPDHGGDRRTLASDDASIMVLRHTGGPVPKLSMRDYLDIAAKYIRLRPIEQS